MAGKEGQLNKNGVLLCITDMVYLCQPIHFLVCECDKISCVYAYSENWILWAVFITFTDFFVSVASSVTSVVNRLLINLQNFTCPVALAYFVAMLKNTYLIIAKHFKLVLIGFLYNVECVF